MLLVCFYILFIALLLASSQRSLQHRWLLCVLVCANVCRQTFFKSRLLLQFLSDSHKTWHTFSMCQYRKKTVEEIFKILILKLSVNFLNLDSLCSSLNWIPARFLIAVPLSIGAMQPTSLRFLLTQIILNPVSLKQCVLYKMTIFKKVYNCWSAQYQWYLDIHER